MGKRLIMMCMVVLLTAPFASAQLWKMKRYEATAALGTSQFYGDIGGFSIGENAFGLKDISFKQTRFSVNGSFRYFITDNTAVRLSLSYALLHATDTRGSNPVRDYEAGTSLFEPALLGEYYFVRNRGRNSFLFQNYRSPRRNRARDFFNSIDGYLFTGIGGAGFDVYKKNNKFLSETPGMTENGFTAIIPFGLGAKVALDPNILVGAEFGMRYAFSDYLDGYDPDEKPGADPGKNLSLRKDVYHTFTLTFSYRIKTARNGLPSFR